MLRFQIVRGRNRILAGYGGTSDSPTGGRFDSTLDVAWRGETVNCSLLMTLNVKLTFVPGNRTIHDADGVEFPIVDWSENEKREYSRLIAYHATRFFDDRFWLEPAAGVNVLDAEYGRPGIRRNVACRFLLRIIPPGSIEVENQEIDVVRLPDREGRGFRSHSHLMTNRDIWNLRQLVFLHEIGHLIGWAHDGSHQEVPKCVDAPNSEVCYGPLDLMGAGMMLQSWHARPWLLAIAEHTLTRRSQWTGHLNSDPDAALPRRTAAARQTPAVSFRSR